MKCDETTLATLNEISAAMEENETVVEALAEAIGKRAAEADFQAHASNETVHIVASEREKWDGYEQSIAHEATVRAGRDAAIQQMCESLENSILQEELNREIAVSNAEQLATQQLDAETSARQKADANLQSQINNLSNDINTTNTNISNAEEQIELKLDKAGGKMSGVLNAQDVVVAAGKRLYLKYDTGSNLGARVYSTARQNLTLGASDESNYFLNLGVMESAWAFVRRISMVLSDWVHRLTDGGRYFRQWHLFLHLIRERKRILRRLTIQKSRIFKRTYPSILSPYFLPG